MEIITCQGAPETGDHAAWPSSDVEVLVVRDADGDFFPFATPGNGVWQLHLAFPTVRAVVRALLIHLAIGILGLVRLEVDHLAF